LFPYCEGWVSKIVFGLTMHYKINGFGGLGMNKIIYGGRCLCQNTRSIEGDGAQRKQKVLMG
jgi:hypothetical protein